MENGGFFRKNQTRQYYLNCLFSLGADADTVDMASELIMARVNENLSAKSNKEIRVTRYKGGNELYHFECGDWGFRRIQIEPDIGFVDYAISY